MIKLSVIYNKDKEDAIKIYKELLKYLKTKKKFEILDDKNLSQAEYMVVIGGDGTLLR
ncbi:ATP-NAD kinase, partial [Fusobacterium vincentii ATCC 51190]